MLFPKLGERGDRDIKGIISIMLMYAIQVVLLRYTTRLLKGLDGRSRLFVDIIGEGGKALLFGAVEEATFLEEERQIFLATDLS